MLVSNMPLYTGLIDLDGLPEKSLFGNYYNYFVTSCDSLIIILVKK